MSREEVADLVTRVRQTQSPNVPKYGRKKRKPSRSSCAARYSRLVGCSLTEAGRVFGISQSSVSNAYSRIYGGAR